MASRRRLARIAVMQTLFETDFAAQREQQQSPAEVLQRNIGEQGAEVVDVPFAHELLEGTSTHREDILMAIEQHAPQWPLERMDGISRALLIIGTYELLFAHDAPPAVAMDEAIEIAKEYGVEESGKFVNGVLNAIAHESKHREESPAPSSLSQ